MFLQTTGKCQERKGNIMRKRQLTAALLAGAMVATAISGCGGSKGSDAKTSSASAKSSSASSSKGSGDSGKKETVNLWATGSDNVRVMYETLVADFNNSAENGGKYEVKLNFMLSGTGAQTLTDMLAAAFKAGQKNTDYDLVDLSGDDLSKMNSLIGEKGFLKLDASKIPNAANISAKSSVLPEYAQGFRGTAVVLAYDSAKVKTPPKTMDELLKWMKENPGRFSYNVPGTGGAGDSFARSTVYNFLPEEAFTSDDEKWVGQWDKGFKQLAEINKSAYESGGKHVYPNKNQGALDLLNQGEIDMCPMWADMVLSQRNSGAIKDTIKITQIQPTFTGALQTLSIPSFGSHEDGASAFINFMLTKEAQQKMVSDMAAIPLIPSTNLDMKGFEDLGGLDTSKFRIQSIGALSTQFNERWDSEIATIG